MKNARKVWLAIGAVCVLAVLTGLYIGARGFSASPGMGQHLPHVDWLPVAATDVSFYRNGDSLFPMYCFECTISYEDMLKYADQEGWKLTEKAPVRLSPMRDLLKLPRLRVDQAIPESYDAALQYETEQSNGGGIQVVYHRPSSRLFVYYSAN